jgi:antitoxin ParD1/3/4
MNPCRISIGKHTIDKNVLDDQVRDCRRSLTMLTIQLPESARELVDNRVTQGRYRSAEDYILDLIEEDHERERIDALLEEAEQSGPATPVTPEFWESLHERIRARGRELEGSHGISHPAA